MWVKWDMSDFDYDPLICNPALFPVKNSPKSANSNRIFPGIRRKDQVSILPCTDIPKKILFFSILAIFRAKRGVTVGLKVKNFGCMLFLLFLDFSNSLSTVFLSFNATTGEDFSEIRHYLRE